MMDCLLVGYSRFAQRRVIPALAELDAIAAIHVATRSGEVAAPKLGRVFRDYAQAIDEVAPGLVYVSLTNDAHATWVERALERGHHVIVDKPSVTDLADAERIAGLARTRKLVLAEAVTYAFHPVIDELRTIFAEYGSRPTHVIASFTPPVPKTDYRWQRELGGGALLDTGPYFASLGRLIWDEEPSLLAACIDDVWGSLDTSYSVLARYPGGGAVVGHFGFTTEYTCSVQVLGPALSVTVPRIFSTPPEMVTPISVRHRDQVTERSVPAASAMTRFLASVLEAIRHGDHETFTHALLRDARVLDQLRRAAQR